MDWEDYELYQVESQQLLPVTMGVTVTAAAAPSVMITPPRHSVATRRFLPALLSDTHTHSSWLEIEDDLAILLENNTDSLQLFQSVHSLGVSSRAVLQSLAYLSSPAVIRQHDEPTSTSTTSTSTTAYADAISTLALYLAQPTVSHAAKLASLRLLWTLRTPLEAGWQLQENVLHETLHFVTDRAQDWEYLEHSDPVLLWELRAICLNEQDRAAAVRSSIQRGGATAAATIQSGARLVETGLSHSTVLVTAGIDRTADLLKSALEPDKEPWMDPRSGVITLTYTDAAKRATASVRESTQACVTVARGVSSRGLQAAATHFQQEGMGEKLVPHPEHRTVLTAAGHVGMASLGAAAIVGEALFDSTRAIAQKTTHVTADVVQHKYGTSAGQLVRDASDTAGNILRTIAQVATLDGMVLGKIVAKDTGKMHFVETQNTATSVRETDAPSASLELTQDSDGKDGIDESSTVIVKQVDKDDIDSETGVGLVDIRTIFLSGPLAGSERKNVHDRIGGGGNEMDETESLTVCGDESVRDVYMMPPRLTLEAERPDERGGLQIHTGYNRQRTESHEAVFLTL